MAKLSSYYTLCPLIDQQSLLGVEKDANSGCVIVTLGKSIVIRYKLQDLKQLSSWTSKDRLTTQVIYDEIDSRYVAIFNENFIRVWTEDESDLDIVKKHKFRNPFHTILKIDDYPPILVRQNGSTASLNFALENRKSWEENNRVLKKGEKIKSSQLININNKMYLCLLTTLENLHNYIVVPLNDSTYTEDVENLRRIEIQRTSESLVGHVVTQDKNNAYLLTLWSHGRLYSFPLIGHSANPPPGNLLSVITAVGTKHPVIMTPLNEITIAAYGADPSEEGAVLVIYNLGFKLAQATEKLKLYTKDAKMWRVEDKLLLAANRHLAVAPYNLTPQRIEAMIGSSRNKQTDQSNSDDNEIVVIQEMETVNWGSEPQKPKKFSESVPAKLKKQISTLMKEGLPETLILETLIPPLIESKDITNIIWCLKNFSDMPEHLLIKLLSFCLTTSDDTFDSIQNGFTDVPQVLSPAGRVLFLNHILSVSYSDVCLLSQLRTGIGFNQILVLLNYLTHVLDAKQEEQISDHLGDSQPSEERFIDWASLLLDSHYQQYLLSQDSKVSKLLEQLTLALDTHFQLVDDLETLRPLIERLRDGKQLVPTLNSSSKHYSIEEVKLF